MTSNNRLLLLNMQLMVLQLQYVITTTLVNQSTDTVPDWLYIFSVFQEISESCGILEKKCHFDVLQSSSLGERTVTCR